MTSWLLFEKRDEEWFWVKSSETELEVNDSKFKVFRSDQPINFDDIIQISGDSQEVKLCNHWITVSHLLDKHSQGEKIYQEIERILDEIKSLKNSIPEESWISLLPTSISSSVISCYHEISGHNDIQICEGDSCPIRS